MYYRYIVFFLLLLSCSESNRKDDPIVLFSREYNSIGEELNIHPAKLNSYGRMILFEDEECIIKENLRGNHLLEKIFYNIDSIIPIAYKGNGPKEYLHVSLMQKESNKSYQVFDIFKNTVYTKDLANNILDTVKIEQSSFHIIHTKNGFISNSIESNYRYSIFDCSGKLVNSFGEFPNDGIDIPIKSKHFAYQGLLVYNYNLAVLASISYSGAIIEFYKLEEDNPKSIKLSHTIYPAYEDASTDKIISVKHNKENILGYIDMYATNKYVYALYSGKQVASYMEGNNIEKARKSSKILIYDWNGSPICILNTDKEIMNISVSADDSYIIALGWDNDYKLYRFNLSQYML